MKVNRFLMPVYRAGPHPGGSPIIAKELLAGGLSPTTRRYRGITPLNSQNIPLPVYRSSALSPVPPWRQRAGARRASGRPLRC